MNQISDFQSFIVLYSFFSISEEEETTFAHLHTCTYTHISHDTFYFVSTIETEIEALPRYNP